MKRFISLMIAALMLLASFAVVSASAAEAAQTIIDVNAGDTVSYSLTVSDLPEKVVGCDFSIYYDSSVLSVDSVADFTGSTDESDHRAVINADIDGEVRGNWSILSGVSFDGGKDIATVNFTAKSGGSTHVNYYVRYLYPDSMIEFTTYKFTCTVTVNGATVLDNAAPELNVDEAQTSGEFVNSVSGDSSDAGVNTASNSGNGSNGEVNENEVDSSKNGATTAQSATTANTPNSKNVKVVATEVDDFGNVIEVTEYESATADQTASSGPSAAMWIIIGLIVVAAAAGVIYLVMRKKKTAE